MDSAEANRRTFDLVADQFNDLSLMPPERNLLVRMGDQLHTLRMLDIGIGAGRTGYTFAPLVRSYVGIDYSPRMLERARARLGVDNGPRLVVADARDLSLLRGPEAEKFDLVIFSFCGIDAVGDEDRHQILAEVRSVIASGGLFLFSAHSTGALPLTTELPGAQHNESRARRVYRIFSGIRYARQIRETNRAIDFDHARDQGWVVIKDPAHDFSLDVYYIDPVRQVEQLKQAGFAVVEIYDNRGDPVQLPFAGRDDWLDYLCTPA